ncbi:MAG: tetratricopeptide repeat protein [Pseudomonadota bacterium]
MLISATAALLVAFGQTGAGDAGRLAEAQRLDACIAKIGENPEEAYEDGLAWINEGARPFARQCTALALVELGHAAEGAARLEELANAEDGGSLGQRVIYLTQSGNAWLVAGQPAAALVTLNNAIRLSPQDPELKADRAAAFMELGKWGEAQSDLNEALIGLPSDSAILKMRAETRLNLNDLSGAENDVARAISLNAEDIDAYVLRGRVREARRIQSEEGPPPDLLIRADR